MIAMGIKGIHTYIKLTLALGVSSVLMTAQPVSAGFEWVPATQNTAPEVVTPDVIAPAPVSAPPPAIITNAQDIEGLEQPALVPVSPAPAYEPAPTNTDTGMLKTIDLLAQPDMTEPEPMPMKTIEVKRPTPVPAPIPAPQIQQFEVQERVVTTPKVIMPADAPQSAMANTDNSQHQNEEILRAAPVPMENIETAKPASSPVTSQPLSQALPNNTANAVGFGTDMPLAIALGQVVPSSYAYSFEPGVNPGSKVSWNGGKPWSQVIEEMLTPLNLTATIRGNSVHVKRAHGDVSALDIEATEIPSIELSMSLNDSEEDLEAFSEDIPMEKGIEAEEPPKPLIATTTRARIQDPGEFETEQAPAAIDRMEQLTTNTQGKSTDDLNAVALELSEKKKLEISPHPIANPIVEEQSVDLYESYERAPPPPSPVVQKIEPALGTQNIEQSFEPIAPVEQDDMLVASIRTSRQEPKVKPTLIVEPPKISATKKEELIAGADPISISKIRFWEAKQGSSLRDTLTQWSAKANTTLAWNASEDYIIKSNILVNDTFQNAIQKVFIKVLEDPTGPSLELISEAGTAAPSQLVISDRH